MAKTSIGTVWVNVKPSLDGVQNAINSQLKGVGSDISDKIGGEMIKSTAIGSAIGTLIAGGVDAAMGKATQLISDALNTMDSMVRSQNALEQMGYDAGAVSEKLQQLRKNANKTSAEVGDLADGFLNLTASWKDIDLTADATQALSDAILSFGGTPDQVANAITQISQVDIDGPLDAQTWLSLRNSGLIPVLGTIARMNNMSLGEFKTALGQGELTTRDFIEALIDLDKNGNSTQASLEEIAKSNASATWSGAWSAASETVSSAVSDSLQELWESSDAGQKILDVADKVAEKIPEWTEAVKDFFDWLNSSDDAAQALKLTLEAISLTSIVTGAKTLATTLLPKIVGFFGAIKGAVAALATPFNIVVAAVSLLVVVLRKAILDTFGSFSSWFETLKVSWNSFWNNLGSQVEYALYLVGTTWRQFWQGVGDAIESIWNGITEFFSGVFQSIKDVFVGVGNWFGEVFTGAYNNIKSAFSSVGQFFSDIWNNIKNAFSGAWQLGQDIVTGLANGITDAATWLGQKIQEFCEGALEGIKNFFGIHSPSKVMAEMGGYLVEGLANGIDADADMVARSMRNMSEDALSEMATMDAALASGATASLNMSVNSDMEPQSRVVQNNNITIADGFDLKLAEKQLGYAVAMA